MLCFHPEVPSFLGVPPAMRIMGLDPGSAGMSKHWSWFCFSTQMLPGFGLQQYCQERASLCCDGLGISEGLVRGQPCPASHSRCSRAACMCWLLLPLPVQGEQGDVALPCAGNRAPGVGTGIPRRVPEEGPEA